MKEVIRIRGRKPLYGTVNISGSKNLCLALIAASLLSSEVVTLCNIPPIKDVEVLIEILKKLNVKVQYNNSTIIIDPTNIKNNSLLMDEMELLRASYYLYPIMIGMFKNIKAKSCGGCRLGERPIDLHLFAFEQLGVKYKKTNNEYEFDGNNLTANEVAFEKISFGATINAILLAVQIKGISTLKNAAKEPEIVELIKFLNKMGASILINESDEIVIQGGYKLHGTKFYNMPDRIEAGTYAIISASCGENVTLKNINVEHIRCLLDVFDVLNVHYIEHKDSLTLKRCRANKGVVILTSPYPGFPTDLQQPLTSFLTINKATSVIIETVFQDRFAHIEELNKMGANIVKTNMNIVIHGVNELKGTEVDGKDLRGAASLVIAGLMARGETRIRGIKYLNRGYENMVEKLKKLHADIELI